MPLGPIEVTVVEFPGSQFNGMIAPALADAVASGNIRILDLVFVTKTGEDDWEAIEIDDLDDADLGDLGTAVTSTLGLLSEDDLEMLANDLDTGSSLVAIVFEHAWASELATAVRESRGAIVFNERIPGAVAEAAISAARQEF